MNAYLTEADLRERLGDDPFKDADISEYPSFIILGNQIHWSSEAVMDWIKKMIREQNAGMTMFRNLLEKEDPTDPNGNHQLFLDQILTYAEGRRRFEKLVFCFSNEILNDCHFEADWDVLFRIAYPYFDPLR